MKNINLLHATKTIAIILFGFALTSCSSSEGGSAAAEGFSSNPVSGTIYGDSFTYSGGFATNINAAGVDKLNITLSQSSLTCNDIGTTTPLSISCPKVIGLSTINTILFFKDLTNGDFINVSSGVQVELISIGETVKGKVKGKSISEDCEINGTFEVPICL